MEELLDLISNESVVFFIGSGVSCSVGYPSAGRLSELLCSKLPNQYQNSFSGNSLEFVKVSEAYSNLNGRNALIDIIFDEFNKCEVNKSSAICELRRMPHIKTIITTNYDNLIETIISDCCVIADNAEVSRANSHKKVIIKIHGDFSHRDNMVITQTDYNKI